jgi:hypothetical protein
MVMAEATSTGWKERIDGHHLRIFCPACVLPPPPEQLGLFGGVA